MTPLFAEQGNAVGPLKENITQKIQKLQAPFIANIGQMDERVRFYAQTFRGTVFVTEDGAIVYSLPEGRGRDVPDGASQQVNAGAEGQGCGRAEEKSRVGRHGQVPLAHGTLNS